MLIPDFEGNWEALRAVVEAGPVVLNHNMETVPRLYARVRPKARYQRSLELIRAREEDRPRDDDEVGRHGGPGRDDGRSSGRRCATCAITAATC